MEKNTNSLNSFGDGQGKDKRFRAQLKRDYEAFKVKPMTNKFCGVMRSNICWYIDYLREQGRIAVIKNRKCAITGRLVQGFTCNTDLFPKSNQFELF